jgi:hypothetical protein
MPLAINFTVIKLFSCSKELGVERDNSNYLQFGCIVDPKTNYFKINYQLKLYLPGVDFYTYQINMKEHILQHMKMQNCFYFGWLPCMNGKCASWLKQHISIYLEKARSGRFHSNIGLTRSAKVLYIRIFLKIFPKYRFGESRHKGICLTLAMEECLLPVKVSIL